MDAYLGDTLTPHGLAWLSALVLPMAIGAACLVGRLRSTALAIAPWTCLPALALALRPLPTARYPWLLLGTDLGLDDLGRVFLLFTSFLWICAGLYARGYLAGDPRRNRFFAFFLLTASGNLGLIMARDMLGFYLFFVLMTFAAYGLIIHDGTIAARRAGLVYITLAVLGEIMLITAFLMLGMVLYGNPFAPPAAPADPTLLLILFSAGFGIKAGAVPLHVWLPLAHPVAPTPASAILSGAMIKAGLLGWIRFLPLGEAALPGWGALFIGAGLAAAFFGVFVGLAQEDPKTILAYSSISQMGIMSTGIGIGFSAPEVWPVTLATLMVYALHHALAKGALFLGVGITPVSGRKGGGALFKAGIVLPALALAGAPLTSGALAKTAMKEVYSFITPPWPMILEGLLILSSVGTALLMSHFILILFARIREDQRSPAHRQGKWAPWLILVLAVSSVAWLLPPGDLPLSAPKLFLAAQIWSGTWTVLLGGLLGWILFRRTKRKGKSFLPPIPAGDLLAGVPWLLGRISDPWAHRAEPALRAWLNRVGTFRGRMGEALSSLSAAPLKGEERLFQWTAAGAVFLLMAAVFLAILSFTRSV
jgi:formate hydrogenlyase subunit 3/multisubunit Na+/H+ antiporter MnhD subunit